MFEFETQNENTANNDAKYHEMKTPKATMLFQSKISSNKQQQVFKFDTLNENTKTMMQNYHKRKHQKQQCKHITRLYQPITLQKG